MKLLLPIFFAIAGIAAFANNHDARYLLLKKEYVFNSDGGYTLNYEHKLRYNTYHSFHRLFGETFVVYDPQYQALKINRLQTTMVDGKVITGPENALNEVLPSWAANSGAYNHIREMVITHTGLEIGAVADLSYTITSKKPPVGHVQILEPLRINMPVDDLELVFVVPAGVDFSISEKPGMPRPQIISETSKTTYRYRMVDVPAVEMFGIVEQSFIPHVQAQTGTKTLSDLLTTMDSSTDEVQPITKEQLDLVLETQQELMTIRTVNVPLDFQLFPLQTPDVTTSRNSGTPIEKALLFQHTLKEKGIPSSILLKIPEPLIDVEHANILAASEILVLVYVNQTPVAISPIRLHKDNPIDVQGYAYVSRTNKGIKRISGKPSKLLKTDAQLYLANDKKQKKVTLTGTIKTEINGSGLKFLVKQSEQPKGTDIAYGKNMVVKKAESEEFSLQRFDVEITEYQLESKVNIVFVELPLTRQGFSSWHLGSLPDTINSPVRLPFGITEEETFTILLPKGAAPITRQIMEKRKATFGEIELLLHYDKTRITITRKINLRSSLILPKDYPLLLEMSRLWNLEILKGVFIEVK
jgi:hypothetical protein